MVTSLLKTEERYEAALERLDAIFHAKPNTPEGDEAELLVLLIEEYEERHYPVPPPDPVEAIKFRMEQMQLTRADLGAILGQKSRATEILNGQRKLTLPMIRRLHDQLNLPYDVLITSP